MYLSAKQADRLILLKGYLRSGGYLKEEKEIDRLLCQYDGSSVTVKRQYLKRLAALCRVRAYGDLYIPDVSWNEWMSFLSDTADMFRIHLSELEDTMIKMPLSEVCYHDKSYHVFSDAAGWIRRDDIFIFLLKDGNEYFQDNVAAFDLKGRLLWSSRETIDVKNRDGAVFVSLREGRENSVFATAWAGVRYELCIRTGRVLGAVITK